MLIPEQYTEATHPPRRATVEGVQVVEGTNAWEYAAHALLLPRECYSFDLRDLVDHGTVIATMEDLVSGRCLCFVITAEEYNQLN
jgi:hypothetical protein